MTGKYAANVGLHTALIPGNPAGLDPKYTILPESLSKLGYKNCKCCISSFVTCLWHQKDKTTNSQIQMKKQDLKYFLK